MKIRYRFKSQDDFRFSNHALDQMELRNISQADVERILVAPLEVIKENGETIYHGIVAENSKKYLIRIFVNIDKDPALVITVYKTSKIKKYYEGEI